MTCHIVFLSIEHYGNQFLSQLLFSLFIDFGTVVANEMANIFPFKDGSMRDLTSSSFWLWDTSHFYSEKNNGSFIALVRTLLYKIWVLFKSFVAFAVLATVTAFVFRIGLMTSSVFLLACSMLHEFISNSPFRWMLYREPDQCKYRLSRRSLAWSARSKPAKNWAIRHVLVIGIFILPAHNLSFLWRLL